MTIQSTNEGGGRSPVYLKWSIALCGLLLSFFMLSGTALAETGWVASSYTATLNGPSVTEEELWIPVYGLYECSESELDGYLEEPSSSLSVTPSWPGGVCHGPLESAASFDANGCEFELTPDGSEAAIGPEGCGSMRIHPGTAGYCEVIIPAQTGITASYSNEGSGSSAHVNVHLETESLEYVLEGGGICNGKTHTDGGWSSSKWELSAESYNELQLYTPFQVAPAAAGGQATGVSASETTLQGAVNPNALASTYQFEYGTTTSYGSTTSVGELGPETEYVSISRPVENLTPNTVYHYRLKASNDAGTSYSRDYTFKTISSEATGAEILWPNGTGYLTGYGSGAQELNTNAGTVQCDEVLAFGNLLGSGTSASNLSTLAFFNYESEEPCAGPFGTELEVDTNLCFLSFHIGESIGENEAEGSLTIGECLGEPAIEMTSLLCTIKIPAGQTVGPVFFRNAEEEVEVELAMTGITTESSGFFCDKGTYTEAEYDGTILISGDEGGSISIE